MKITLYADGSKMCKNLEARMIEKDIPYEQIDLFPSDTRHTPQLVVGDKVYEYSKALEWVRKM